MARSILVVDDDDDFRTSLRLLLADEGFDVYTARNGRDALDLLQDIEPPGVILLDLMMPVMDGNQFLAERRRNERVARVPVVIMSAWTRQVRGTMMGVEKVITKPINPDDLVRLIERFCERDGVGDPRRATLDR